MNDVVYVAYVDLRDERHDRLGFLWPVGVARESARHGGPGTRKFLLQWLLTLRLMDVRMM